MSLMRRAFTKLNVTAAEVFDTVKKVGVELDYGPENEIKLHKPGINDITSLSVVSNTAV